MTDEEADKLWWHFGMFSLPKAIIIGIVTASAVVEFTGSYGKASWIGGIAFVMSVYTIWRRYLEPISILLFLGMAIVACIEPGVLTKMQGAALAFAGIR
jgi:hypothetical protein